MMEMKLIQMDAKIVNISVELDVLLAIIILINVQVVNYLDFFHKSFIAKIIVEMGLLQKIHIVSILKNVMMEIKLNMMDAITFVDFSVSQHQFAQIVQMIDANNVLLTICSLIPKYVFQYVEIKQQYLMNNVKFHLYYPIRVVRIAKQNVNPLALLVIILDQVVTLVRMVTIELIIYVFQFVEIKQLQKMKNVMMGTQILVMVVINVLLVVLFFVQIVARVFVMIVMKVIIYLICQSGFQNINGTCTPICGDKLVVADEQCDDGNIIFEDGCHVCSKPCSCSYCFEGSCFSCPDNHFLFKHKCFNLEQYANFKETTNFQFSDLSIIQTFKIKSAQTSRIHLKIDQFEKQVYNQVGQYIEIMDKDYSYINIQIIFQCSQNKKVQSQFSISNYENGSNNQENIWLNQCHQTVDHTITYSFRLQKVVLKDEIMLIQISEDELILSILFIRSPQKLLQITLVDI
ncbi:unnamed protein product [Paramecium primaurelia]|uniref:Transmembrane protein n=1 Tax=Paramecium primaurelia TaxID=5886 RepID=A0A8S1QPZ9_PARPR|nr:unnamed protein product [Paramecium primaurelia]